MPDTYKVFASNRPDDELEVDEAELIDLARMGLLVKGKGDISDKGRLKRQVAADAKELDASLPTSDPNTSQGA